MRRVVISGVGCVSPIGIGFAAFAEGIRNGVSGVGPATLFDASPYQCRVAAEVKGFNPIDFMDGREARALPRVSQFAVAAARLAVADAELNMQRVGPRTGIIVGTSSGPIAYVLEQHSIFLERGLRRVHPSSPAYGQNSIVASECAIRLGIHGPVMSISSACTSSCDAIGLGSTLIASGSVDLVIAGGAEAPLTTSLFGSFDRLGMLPVHYNERPSAAARPFSVDREGPVLGEGAAMLVLEAEAHARDRGAPMRGSLLGYGASCDAESHLRLSGDGRFAAAAIEQALSSAKMEPADIEYINAHGTGTPENDRFEAGILARCLGEEGRRIPVSSSKSQFGHLLGAAPAMELAAILAGMRCQVFPPTLNLESPDPECQLNHVREAGVSARFDVALSTSFGFGSRNGVLIVGRHRE